MGVTNTEFHKQVKQFGDGLTSKELKEIRENPEVQRIQTTQPVGMKTWQRLNNELFDARPDINLRLFGFRNQLCDFRFLENMPKVRKLSVNCFYGEATNLDAICDLPDLQCLHIGILDLKDFEFLNHVPNSITQLGLYQTRSKKPNLRSLSRFRQLRTLSIEGHNKGLSSIAELHELEDLTLRSVTVPNLSFLSGLTKLWSVDIKLGGTTDLTALSNIPNLKYLELWMIRALEDISVISNLHSVQNLFLESLSRITLLPDLSKLSDLRRVLIQNLKSLQDFSSLEHAPHLEEFCLMHAKPIQSELIDPLFRNSNLKYASAYFGSDKRNAEFNAKLSKMGLQPFKYKPFTYQ